MLFEEQIARFPNKYPWTQEFINTMWVGFWTPNKFDFKSDLHQFKNEMPDAERRMLVRTLTAIGQIEVAVKTFWAKLGENLPHPSMNDLGITMANIEVIHNIAYEKLLNVLNLTHTFEENLQEPVMKGRVEYLRKYLKKNYKDDKKQYIYSLILFTLFVENVSLFSQFYIVLWLNRNKAILKDCAQQIHYTIVEEGIHAQVGMKIINTMREEYPELFDKELEDRIIEESKFAYETECKVIDWIMNGYEVGDLKADVLKAFVGDRINQSLEQIGYTIDIPVNVDDFEKTYWMNEELYGNRMTDFFKGHPIEYGKENKVYSEDELF